ncbi:MAG TPA: hypothetical protein VE153_17765 [Myxococcus sp.]|nr:hypothetical protein [Myxococcus sp.]
MNPNDLDSLLKGMALEHQRLRRQVRWLTLGLALLLVLMVLGEVIRGPRSAREAEPGELKGTRLVLTDAEGRTRAELGLAPDAREPRLMLYHQDGRPWAALAMASPPGAPEGHEEASLVLQDEAGQARVSLGASQRNSGLVLHNPEGQPGLVLYAGADAQGLAISGGTVPRIHLRYNRHDEANLSELIFQDEEQRPQALLRGGRGGVSLELYRPDGEHAFRTP